MARGFDISVEGDDIWVRGVTATWFGGPDDDQDSGETASGVNTRDHPDILGCALPMDGFNHKSTDGSPIPRLPWNTFVRVTNTKNGKELSVPLIDLGPSLTAPSHAAIDLTEAAFKALGGKLATGTMQVDYVIPGGARFLPGDRLKTVSLSRSLTAAADADGKNGHGISHGLAKPQIKEFIRSPNQSYRNGVKIDMIVLHYTDGPNAQSAIDHFLDQSSQVSAHYIIDRNGDIYQMVSDSDKAWHALAANARSIGIEHVAMPGQQMASAQQEASVALVKWLVATYAVPLSNIKGHRFAPGNAGKTDCPDHLFGPATEAAVSDWVAEYIAPSA